jgi:hypothetical protein
MVYRSVVVALVNGPIAPYSTAGTVDLPTVHD